MCFSRGVGDMYGRWSPLYKLIPHDVFLYFLFYGLAFGMRERKGA